MMSKILYFCFAFFLFSVLEIKAQNTFKEQADSLLHVWCDGMMKWQIDNPTDRTVDGVLYCLGCNKIHGRCIDAVYPFLYMADKTKEQKYIDAAISVLKWADNVSADDGAWTVIPDKNSWKGTTVFGAVSLAEALCHYEYLLPKEIAMQWKARLEKAGNYICDNFTLTFTNINYGVSAIYALHLIGRYLGIPKFISKGNEIKTEVLNQFTVPNQLIWGEGKPYNKLTSKGLHYVDLGYNVEETLNALALYSELMDDTVIREKLIISLKNHLAFMLPDGAWDNSWGTRQYKWSYWGSRTTEGCFPSYGLFSKYCTVFGEAVYKNFELLKRCTSTKYSLLSGGLHYDSHRITPCIHHTFTHAKALVTLLNSNIDFKVFRDGCDLPRIKDCGVRFFPEIDTWLVADDEWKATVTNYDAIYKDGVQQPTGGALSVLYNNKIGLVLCSSMAEYKMVELNNQQVAPDDDVALTPRVEFVVSGVKYNTLYDSMAEVEYSENDGNIIFDISNVLKNKFYRSFADNGNVKMKYLFQNDGLFSFSVETFLDGIKDVHFFIPIVCSNKEKCIRINENEIVIFKNGRRLHIKSDQKLQSICSLDKRMFNMVPGVEFIPLYISMHDSNKAKVIMRVE